MFSSLIIRIRHLPSSLIRDENQVKRFISIFLVVAAIVAIAGTSASASYAECNSGYVCIWYNINGGGTRVESYGNPGTCVPFSGQSWNNQADSFRNRLNNGHHVQFYDGTNCNGQVLWRDGLWMDDGPFAVGMMDNFEWNTPHGSTATIHRNKASSIWFNSG